MSQSGLVRELVDGLERLDRNSIGFGERTSLSAGRVDLRELQEEDFEDDLTSQQHLKDTGSLQLEANSDIRAALLENDDAELVSRSVRRPQSSQSDEHNDQSQFSKAFYKFWGLKWHAKVFDRKLPLGPQMYRFHNIGLYTHYAGVGLSGGISGLCLNFCFYVYKGSTNVCGNAPSLIFLAWGFKIIYAILTDRWRPFGMRRKFYMLTGWCGTLLCTLALAIIGDHCSVSTWIGLSVVTQAFLMLADVPADGYSVELGQLENPEERGMILSTGQRIRFSATMGAGLIQALMVNGVGTNAAGCSISALNCWSWGLTVGQYYSLVSALLCVLVIPIFFLREISCRHVPVHTLTQHSVELWHTLTNPTTLYLLIFVAGNGTLSQLTPMTYNYMQYTLIKLTNFQAGLQAIVTYLAVVMGIKVFQTYFIQSNWRNTLYLSIGLSNVLGLLWLLVYWNVGGLLNPWFTIAITVNQALAQGVSQVLFSMAVIELAKRGQEAITYELIISVANSASTGMTILSTQLLSPLRAVTCTQSTVDDATTGACTADEVNVFSQQTFQDTYGPRKFTMYSVVILSISLCALAFFTRFLPRQKYECAEWKALGDTGKFWLSPNSVGRTSAIIASTIVLYQIFSSIALLNPSTACLTMFGGSGCAKK